MGDLSHKVGNVVELQSYKGGRDTKLDTQNSGKYVVGRVEREWKTSSDQMQTKLTLYTDSPGIE